MRLTGVLIGFLTLAFLLPALSAQDKDKKDPVKAEVKDKADAKDKEKADAKDKDKADAKDKDKADAKDKGKADKEKEPAEPEKKKPEEKVQHGPVIRTKILSMKPDSAHELTVEMTVPDPVQMAQNNMWMAQQMASIQQERNPRNYVMRMQQFQMQMAQRQAQGVGFKKEPAEVRATEECKVRIMYPPTQYDDAGNIKKWTNKELTKLKGNSKLPGYPADFDMLKGGQLVDIYLAKPQAASRDKTSGAANKKKKDEDPPDPAMQRPDVVMIVIIAEPMGR
jgi:hypothetical protein